MPEVYLYESSSNRGSNGRAHSVGCRGWDGDRGRLPGAVKLFYPALAGSYLDICTYSSVVHVFLQEHVYHRSRSQAPTGFVLTTGSSACCQASIPPIILVTCLKPARCNRLQAIMLR